MLVLFVLLVPIFLFLLFRFYLMVSGHYYSYYFLADGSNFSVIDFTTPAAIVVPMSLNANLPISGNSLKVSI